MHSCSEFSWLCQGMWQKQSPSGLGEVSGPGPWRSCLNPAWCLKPSIHWATYETVLIQNKTFDPFNSGRPSSLTPEHLYLGIGAAPFAGLSPANTPTPTPLFRRHLFIIKGGLKSWRYICEWHKWEDVCLLEPCPTGLYSSASKIGGHDDSQRGLQRVSNGGGTPSAPSQPLFFSFPEGTAVIST